MLTRGSRQEGAPANTQTLRMAVAEVHPANTPPRLFQLFSGHGGGGVVWTDEAAEMLQEAQGWTAQPVELTVDEARYLTTYAGRTVRPGQIAFFVRCDGFSKQDGNRVLCVAPAGMEASRLSTADITSAQGAPALQYIPERQITSVIALTGVPGSDVGVPGGVRQGAGDFMRLYRQIEEFFRAYVACSQLLGRAFAPELEEANLIVKLRDFLARFAQPVMFLRGVEGKGNTELEPARLSIEAAASFIGAVFLASAVNLALGLLNAALGEAKLTHRLINRLKRIACKRIKHILATDIRLSREQQRAAECLASFDCPPERVRLPTWAKVAIGAGAVAGVVLVTQRGR